MEYDHYGGFPNQCDCDGNCRDSYGFWYAYPDYTGSDFEWGYASSVDVGWDYTDDDYWDDWSDDDRCADSECGNEALFWDVDIYSEYYYPGDLMTRGEVADMFYRYDIDYPGIQ